MNSSTEPSTLHESPVRRVDAGPSLEGTPYNVRYGSVPVAHQHHHTVAGGRSLFPSTLFADDLMDEPPPMARSTQPPLPTVSPGLTFGVPPLGPPPPLPTGAPGHSAAVPFLNREDLMSPMSAAAATNNSSVVHSAGRQGMQQGATQSNPPSAARMGRRASSAGHRGLRSAASTPRLGAAERAQQSFIAMKGAQLNAQRSILESASKHRLQRTLTSQALNTTARSSMNTSKQTATMRRKEPFTPVPASQFFAESSGGGVTTLGANNNNTTTRGGTKDASFAPPMESTSSQNFGRGMSHTFDVGGGGGSFHQHQHNTATTSPLLPAPQSASSAQLLASWDQRPCLQCGGIITPSYHQRSTGPRSPPPSWSGEGAVAPVTEFEVSMVMRLQNLGRSLRRDLK